MTNDTNDGLVITPAELKFRFQLGKTIPTQIILYNPTSERFAFKVKTTSPKKYCVRPSSGFVEPMSNKHVEVIMQCQKEYPTDLGNCKDKFLLQSVAGPFNETDVTAAMFEKGKGRDVKESKLKVLLEGPPAPPSPIREERVEGSEDQSDVPKQNSHHSKYKNTSANLSMVEPVKNERGEREQAISQMLSKGGFTMVHMMVAVIFAFIIGHYTK